ncbi:FAD-binding oxidoreductase [Corynebacterium glyciniphilum]|uniref:FAD-binding oxidoreductase n=1 Tax=Corynebacterium glyciniphilum TaxID=1404244 RepID=UPI003DA16AC2
MTTTTAKTRSWWGWGNVDDAVTGSEKEELLNRVRLLLPDADLSTHEPPEVADLTVPAPRIQAPTSLGHLASDDLTDRVAHAHGKAYRDVIRNLKGQVDDVPDLVVRPRTEQDVVDVLQWSTDAGVALVPFGGGSSVTGGVEPRGLADTYPGVVCLDMTDMDQILEIDHTSRAARIQAGAYGPAIEDGLKPHGLTLRHFPQSFEFSTLGGWLATRAGGHFATVYTHIDDLVESMRVITPVGAAESWRLPGSGAGPSQDRMFLGSEGTLGVITEAWMRLQDRPRWRTGASVIFNDYSAAVQATREIAQSGLYPANCRLLDPVEAILNAGTPTSGGVLVLGFESASRPMDDAMSVALEICQDHGGIVPDGVRSTDSEQQSARAGAAGTWRSSFIRMPYQRDALAQSSMIVETFETSCTWDKVEQLRDAVNAAAMSAFESLGITGVVSCRFTHVYPDGPAPYFGIYAGGTWDKTVEQWDQIKAAVSQVLLEHRATITHHHSVGRDHRPWYDRQRSEPFARSLRANKDALDPAGVLNPGVLIDPRRP